MNREVLDFDEHLECSQEILRPAANGGSSAQGLAFGIEYAVGHGELVNDVKVALVPKLLKPAADHGLGV